MEDQYKKVQGQLFRCIRERLKKFNVLLLSELFSLYRGHYIDIIYRYFTVVVFASFQRKAVFSVWEQSQPLCNLKGA